MSDSLTSQIEKLKIKQKLSKKAAEEFARESPLVRYKAEIRKQLENAERYRVSVLKGVNTFAGLSDADLLSAAQSFEEVYYRRGDFVIEQDDIGDSFFVLEDGHLNVTRKSNPHDKNEVAKEINQLRKNATFGEIALITEEPRTATVTVISETAKCLKMTKSKFNEVVSTTRQIVAESRALIGKDVIEKVPLFKSLSALHRAKLLDAMQSVTFNAGVYICRQGSIGNAFFIITEGSCRVTLNADDFTEKEVNTMFAGDFFGEVALIEAAAKRTANVIAVDTVSCMSLSKADFDFLLKGLKSLMIQNHQVRHMNDERILSSKPSSRTDAAHANKNDGGIEKRRISGFDNKGHRHEPRMSNLLKRMGKFMFESLYDSLYGRLYREILLNETKALEYGDTATNILNETATRVEAIKALRVQVKRILDLEPASRTTSDNSFIGGLMRQRNMLHEKLCHNWPAYQFNDICKKLRLVRVKPLRRIFEIGARGTCVFVILRGCVRIFSAVRRDDQSDSNSKKLLQFEEDLYPGEYFGEAVLNGVRTRMVMAQALTAVDLVTFEDDDFLAAQDSSIKMSMEQRLVFLSNVAPFKHWEKYRLHRIAHSLDQAEFEIGHQILTQGTTSKCLYFLLNGRVDIVPSPHQTNSPIATLQKFECFGEASFINSRNRVVKKFTEEFFTVSVTRVDVLMLPAANFNLIEEHTADTICTAFVSKLAWRQRRYQEVRLERKQIRLLKNSIADAKLQLKLRSINPEVSVDSAMSSVSENIESSPSFTPAQAPSSSSASVSASLASPSWVSTIRPQPLTPLSPGSSLLDFQPNVSSKSLAGHSMKSTVNSISLAAASSGVYTLSANDRLEDIDDIPTILDRDFDPFMIIHSCRSDKERAKMQQQLTSLRRPKISQKTHGAVSDLQDGGFRATIAALRPITSYGVGRIIERNSSTLQTPRNSAGVAASSSSSVGVFGTGARFLEVDNAEEDRGRTGMNITTTAAALGADASSALFGSTWIPNGATLRGTSAN